MHRFAHWLGLDPGYWQAFWQGAGADLGELAIIGGMINMARRHNCHVKGCFRVGRHPVEGTPWVVCARHHPTGAPTHADVMQAVR